MPAAETRFAPTLREVMLRPWWIGMLFVALAVAGVFAWLGQWQLSSAIDTSPTPVGATEEVRPIDEVLAPGDLLAEPMVGQRVSLEGEWIGDLLIVSSRVNGGVEGYWITAQVRVDGAALAVALAWAPTRDAAEAAIADLSTRSGPIDLVGRLVSDEGRQPPGPGESVEEMTRMSPVMLLGQWQDVPQEMYRAYLVADPIPDLPAGVDAIDSPPPHELSSVNWLNIFYAIEWVVFAAFAFYMWYRLARDAWEREGEEFAERAAVDGGETQVHGD